MSLTSGRNSRKSLILKNFRSLIAFVKHTIMKDNNQLITQVNILIVDDLETNRLLLRRLLNKMGANLIMAHSGNDALNIIVNQDIALALIDVHMPEMNGFELAQLMQNNSQYEFTPIIFLTAHHEDISEIEKYYIRGVVDFIAKPFKSRILLGKVEALLELQLQKVRILEQKNQMERLVEELKNSNRELEVRLLYEKLLTRISEMAVSDKCTEDFFSKSLAEIGKAIEASRTYIIEYRDETETLCNTHEWCAEGISAQKENLQAVDVSEIPWWHNTLKNGQLINYHDTDDIPEHKIREILKAQDIFSILVVPLFANGNYFGHIGFDFCFKYRQWEERDVSFLLAISRIISSVIERNMALNEMQQKVETQLALINASLDSFFLIEPDGKIITHNDVMAQRLNFGPDELIGKCVYDLLPDDVRIRRKSKIEEVLRTGLPLRFEDCRNNYYFEHSLYPVKDADGKVYRIAIFGKDLTKRIHAEAALRESEKMYRTLLSASPQGIIILDMKRTITNISDITVDIFGAGSKNDFCGKDFFSLIPEKEANNLKTILSKTISDGVVQSEEIILEKKNKSPFIGELSATLIQDDDGSPKAYMIIIRDISQRKIMEQQLIRSERMVSLGEMASGMAHEINQPLLSIQLGIENVMNKLQQINAADKSYLKRKTEKIFEDIVRIGQIIDHVRAFSKDQEYIHATFNINESIRNAVSMISQQFKHRNIQLTLNLNNDIKSISGNIYRFEQVLLNLLSNAKDAIEEKEKIQLVDFEKSVVIKTYQANNMIIVEVQDNGCGIDENEIDRLMLPFYTTKELGKGTGLGLAISFSIVKEFDGNIRIESQQGVGSNFKIEIPVV